VNNPRLFPLIDEPQRIKLQQLDRQALWVLEDKYDADIHTLYGSGRIQHETALQKFLVLNWRHDAEAPVHVDRVDITARPELLAAIMKPSGPFYVDAQGRFNEDDNMPDAAQYLEALADVSVYEAGGRIDFERLQAICLDSLLQ
jgi:HprK-related kinase B